MPWPDFSELSFGFAFLREYENLCCGGSRFPSAPEFITQQEEAIMGYDVSVVNDGIPVFFQFKRSFVLSTRNAKEIQGRCFDSPPLYRMELYRRNMYRQHAALRELERSGESVYYVTSQVSNKDELNACFQTSDVVRSGSALFSPLEINLPNQTDDHYITFRAEDNFAYLFSPEGIRFRRKYPQSEMVYEEMRISRSNVESSKISSDERLKKISNFLLEINPELKPYADKFERPEIKASILSYMILDAHLTFFSPIKKSY